MPSNRQIFLDNIGQTSQNPIGIEISNANGIFMYDKNGKEFIDLVSGVSVSNLGHNHPEIKKAIINQLDKYSHLMVYGELIQEPQTQFAEALISILPNNFDSIYYVNSGSEAIDGVMKMAKKYTGRYEIISCKNAYHGSTGGALSIYGGESIKDPFRPLIPGIKQIRYNNFEDLKKISNKTAAVIIEPIQGEAGIILPEPNYLEAVKAACEKNGALLIFDEIQTGFGRTGEFFAFQKLGVTPDAFTIAKAMGAGLPIGAWVCNKNIMDCLSSNPELGHITTFGGNPVAAAAANANIRFLIKNKNQLINQVENKAKLFYDSLVNHKIVKEIRYKGLYMAVNLESSRQLFKLMDVFKKDGILSDWFLFDNQSFRISPPITISEDEIVLTCNIILKSLDKVLSNEEA